MFTDYTKIIIKAGDGGNGVATFRREKNMLQQVDLMAETAEMAEIYIFKLIKIKIH